jgi:hypothetical protein
MKTLTHCQPLDRCSVPLGIQYATRIRRIILVLSTVDSLAVKYFSILSHIQHDLRGWGGGGFGRELIKHKKCYECICNFRKI